MIDGGHPAFLRHAVGPTSKSFRALSLTRPMLSKGAGLNANTQRRPMSSVDKFRAMVVIGDLTAVKIHELLVAEGYEAMGIITVLETPRKG